MDLQIKVLNLLIQHMNPTRDRYLNIGADVHQVIG